MVRYLTFMLLFAVGPFGIALADSTQKNRFASIYLEDDKIGHVHLTSVHGPSGEVEELRANASVSFLGMNVYAYRQENHEIWSDGELQEMTGFTDDNGTHHEVSLKRNAKEYAVEYNYMEMDLPHEAFPTSIWHYGITESTLLFNIINFDLLEVQINEAPDSITIGDKTIPATRFDYTGDWKATLWFDASKSFLKGNYDVAGQTVTVELDP